MGSQLGGDPHASFDAPERDLNVPARDNRGATAYGIGDTGSVEEVAETSATMASGGRHADRHGGRPGLDGAQHRRGRGTRAG